MTKHKQVYTLPDGTKTKPLTDAEALAAGFCPFCSEFQYGFLADDLRVYGACNSCCASAEPGPEPVEQGESWWQSL